MFDFLMGAIRTLIGGYVMWVFGSLGVAAIRNKDFRKELLKTSRIAPPSKTFNAVIALLFLLLWLTSLWLCISGIQIVVDSFL